jgi:hypothetical protein
MSLELQLRVAGLLIVILAVAHIPYYWWFHWDTELPRLSRLNHQIFLVHCFFLCLFLVLLGGVSALQPEALLEGTRLSRYVLAGVSLTWAIRLGFQLFIYDHGHWSGSPSRTAVHVGFIGLWSYLTAVYGSALATTLR